MDGQQESFYEQLLRIRAELEAMRGDEPRPWNPPVSTGSLRPSVHVRDEPDEIQLLTRMYYMNHSIIRK